MNLLRYGADRIELNNLRRLCTL